MADIAVITGASSGLGVKFLEAVVNRYRSSPFLCVNSLSVY